MWGNKEFLFIKFKQKKDILITLKWVFKDEFIYEWNNPTIVYFIWNGYYSHFLKFILMLILN